MAAVPAVTEAVVPAVAVVVDRAAVAVVPAAAAAAVPAVAAVVDRAAVAADLAVRAAARVRAHPAGQVVLAEGPAVMGAAQASGRPRRVRRRRRRPLAAGLRAMQSGSAMDRLLLLGSRRAAVRPHPALVPDPATARSRARSGP